MCAEALLFVPFCVHDVVLGDADVQFLGLFGIDFLDEFGGYAAPEFAVAYFGAFQDKCACCDDGAFADDGVVEDGGSHADECTALDGAAVQGDVMPDGDVVAYFYGGFLIEGVEA